MGAPWSSIISAIAGHIDNTKTNWMNFLMNERTNLANRQMVDATNQANVDLWHEQSQYNSPVEQFQRLKAAGINPSLIYGTGGITNAADAPPAMLAGQDRSIQFTSSGLVAAEIAKLAAETRSIEDDNSRKNDMHGDEKSKLREQINNLQKQTSKLDTEGKLLSNELQLSNSTLKDRIEAELQTLQGQAENGRLTYDQAAAARTHVVDMAQAAYDKVRAEADILLKEKEIKSEYKDLIHEQVNQYKALVDKLQKENEWFVADRIVGYLTDLAGVALGFTAVGQQARMASAMGKVAANRAARSAASAEDNVDLSGYNLFD